METALGLLLLVLYFLPAIGADLQKHPNAFAIGVLNLFLGWTIIGWIGALVWASTMPAGKIREA